MPVAVENWLDFNYPDNRPNPVPTELMLEAQQAVSSVKQEAAPMEKPRITKRLNFAVQGMRTYPLSERLHPTRWPTTPTPEPQGQSSPQANEPPSNSGGTYK